MGILAFDFGGSAVKYGYWDGERLSDTANFSTPETWSEMKKQLFQVFNQLSKERTIDGVALSAPGVVNSERRMIEGISAIPYIHGFDIYQELEEMFELPVAIENDANCAGMAEFYEGAAQAYQNVAFVVIGTGIGGAMFTNGELNKGAHLYGGEFGLMFLDGDKTFSKVGTAVQMAWRYCERKGVDKKAYSGKDVFDLAEKGDQIALEEVEKFYDYLTKGLFSIQFAFDPEVIVLGGGISAKEGLIEEINGRMKKLTSQLGLNDFDPEILVCDYRNDANLIGAAANYSAQLEG
ncbi:ROK family protein [Enterococcus sp. 10A9_DIV0425]|uniref:ROK family protein n=1 Tax=Candidatus Enterococcus wittei TaxID=1987383 RepID=A0A242JXA8_9ENTE|nr:ROK family protein [Enterococcus sp. 10A9_DIV0425]OTP09955.1 ROK family protein [Enterococcus sp. 10A9_DIV0425]THE12563.1 ROK family protein [Enterococcus hirae]